MKFSEDILAYPQYPQNEDMSDIGYLQTTVLPVASKRDANSHNPYMDNFEIGTFSYQISVNTRLFCNILNTFLKMQKTPRNDFG